MKKIFYVMLFALLMSGTGVWADKIGDLEKRVGILAEDLDSLKGVSASENHVADPGKTFLGGYGELHYTGRKGNNSMDFHRFVIFLGHSFSDRVKFNSELEIEHAIAGDGKSGEVELEQAYLDFLISGPLNVRAGLVLIPLGIINETHEPPTFHGVERPEVESKIIPTTWRESGGGVFGRFGSSFNYRAFIVNSGDISAFSKPSDGIRQLRQGSSRSKADNFAFAGRLEYTGLAALRLGASLYTGNQSQGDSKTYGNARVTLWDINAQYARSGLELRGIYGVVSEKTHLRVKMKK